MKKLDDILSEFEQEMFSKRYEITDTLRFELFKQDDDNVFDIGYNHENNTFFISVQNFFPDNGDWNEEITFATYSMDYYNRDFLKYKLLQLYNLIAIGKTWESFEK